MLGIPACNYKRYAFKMMKRIITSLKHLKRKQNYCERIPIGDYIFLTRLARKSS